LNCGKSLVLSLVNGEVKRKVLMPNLIMVCQGRLAKRWAIKSEKLKIKNEEAEANERRFGEAVSR